MIFLNCLDGEYCFLLVSSDCFYVLAVGWTSFLWRFYDQLTELLRKMLEMFSDNRVCPPNIFVKGAIFLVDGRNR